MSTRNIPFSMKRRKVNLNYPKSATVGFFQAVVDEPSVFEPLKFYCTNYTKLYTDKPLSNLIIC